MTAVPRYRFIHNPSPSTALRIVYALIPAFALAAHSQAAPPAAPVLFSATSSDCAVTLQWSPVTGATEYRLYRGASPDPSAATPIATLGSVWILHRDESLPINTQHYYWLRAGNADGLSPFSPERSGQRAFSGRPSEPASAWNATDASSCALPRIEWTPPLSGGVPVTYRVMRRVSAPGEVYAILASIPATMTYFEDPVAIPGTLYDYFISAENPCGVSTFGRSIQGVAAPELPATPMVPESVEVDVGESVELIATGVGINESCLWTRDGAPLEESERISGVTTPQLRITNATPADEARYTLRVGPNLPGNLGPCNAESSPTNLIIRSRCAADFDGSGNLNVSDLFAFLAAFFAGEAAADHDRDGAVTVSDLFAYLADFFRGCD